jgi:hypothetical protein
MYRDKSFVVFLKKIAAKIMLFNRTLKVERIKMRQINSVKLCVISVKLNDLHRVGQRYTEFFVLREVV